MQDILDQQDVSTTGQLCLAVNLGPESCETVINGVHFQADRGHWGPKVMVAGGPVVNGVMYWPDQKSGGYTLSMPWERANVMGAGQSTDAAYNLGLGSGKHIRPGNHDKINVISGLTPGNTYEIQLWCAISSNTNNARLVEWDDGVGGREGAGGIFMTSTNATMGQVATGTFVAHSSGTQTFTCHDQDADPNTTPPLRATWGLLNMFQLRDVSPSPRVASATLYGLGTPGTQRGGRGGEFGGTNCSPAISLSGHPAMNSQLFLTAENSSGAPSPGMIVFGPIETSFPFLGGQLLVFPSLTLPITMRFPVLTGQPHLQDHELQIPVTMPNQQFTVFVQVLQLDAASPGGVSFTSGLKIAVGM